MKRTRTITAGIGLAALGATIVAAAPAETSGESVSLTFQSLAFQEPTVAATDETPLRNEANPDIQVELRQGSWDNVHDELVTQFAGTAPDIIHDESADTMGFAEQGYLADLTPYFGEELIADVPEGVGKPSRHRMGRSSPPT